MLNLPPSASTHERARHFLNTHPHLSASLLDDCEQDMHKVSTFVEPLLEIPPHCGTAFYIQAATTGKTAFLTTNLANVEEAKVTAISTTWLIGRSRNCAITMGHKSISRCHAMIGHVLNQGFYVMDVGSSNGTFLNGQRLSTLERHLLRDGDTLRLSHVAIEFFVVTTDRDTLRLGKTQVQLEDDSAYT
jgi:hypothetical protein